MLPALRRAVGLVLLLVPLVAVAGSDRALDLDDVLRLHAAGVSEDIIISEIIVTDSVFHLDVDDILRFQEAGVSERLLQFLIDTGRDVAEEESDVDGTLWADEVPGDDTASGEEWVNEIEELEPTTTYLVSLNYSYPSWWYDCYWYDYWYWDFHYYPYSCSYVGHLGTWYPGWYSYRWCWTPAYWGYRSWWYDRWDYPWYVGARYCYDDWYYDPVYRSGWGGRDHVLSQTKTKTGTGSAGLPLYADAGLKVPDGGRLKVRDAAVRPGLHDKSRDGRLAVSDPDRTGGKRPVRTPSGAGEILDSPGGRKPLVPDRSAVGVPAPVRTPEPVRDVRTPAGGGRPIKIRTLSDPTGKSDAPSRDDPPSPPTRPGRPVETPAPDRTKEGEVTPKPAPDVKPTPTPAPKKPAVAPQPSKPPSRTVKPAPAPAPKSSPPSRSSTPRTKTPKPRGGKG